MNQDSEEWQQWLSERPQCVRDVAEKLPAWNCYRSKEYHTHHYAITSYEEKADGTVTVKVAHGHDSPLAGIEVFGLDPDMLIVCGCGNWSWPDPDQTKFMARRIQTIADKQQ